MPPDEPGRYSIEGRGPDFTFVDGVVYPILLLIDTPSIEPTDASEIEEGGSLSSAAQYRYHYRHW
jgi:hypothetical protein